MLRYRTFPTTADLGVFVYGNRPNEVFENFAYALRKIIAGNKKLKPFGAKEVKLKFASIENGLFLWASELLFMYDSQRLLPLKAEVRLGNNSLSSLLQMGELKSPPQMYIKAITLHRLSLEKRGKLWRATLVLDI